MEPANKSTNEEGLFDEMRAVKQLEISEYKDEIRKARNALFWVAGLVFFAEVIVSYMQTGAFDNFVLLFALIVAGIFVGLAFWTKKKPYTALLLGLVFYLLYIALVAYVNGEIEGTTGFLKGLFGGIIIKVVIIVLLIKGLGNAKKLQQEKESGLAD